MKTTFKSEEPKKLIYHDYSNFSCQEKHDYSDLEKKCIDTLNKDAPKKIKASWGNQKAHINKHFVKLLWKDCKLKTKQTKLEAQ